MGQIHDSGGSSSHNSNVIGNLCPNWKVPLQALNYGCYFILTCPVRGCSHSWIIGEQFVVKIKTQNMILQFFKVMTENE